MPDDILDNLDLGDDPVQPGANQDNKSVKPVENLDPEIQKRDAQIAHWRDKAIKLAEEKGKPQEPAKPNENVPVGVDPFEAVRLGKALKDYDEDETSFIVRNAKSKAIEDIIKAEKDEMVQLAIKSRREKVARENKVPSPSSPGGGSNEKSPQEIAKMSRDEHMAYERELLEKERGSQGV